MVPPCLNQWGGGMASGLCNDIVKFLFGHLKSRVGYLVHSEKKVNKLKEKFEDLESRRNDVLQRRDAADRAGEVINHEVVAWLNKVSELEELVKKISTEVTENKRCFKGCCPNWAWRYKLGKKATKKKVDVEELEKKKFPSVSQLPSPPGIDAMPARDFMDFSSTRKAMNEVLDAMRDQSKKLIGIYGMGGVGKTYLMDELGLQFSKDKEFGTIVKVIVSQNPEIAQVRRNIADELGLKFWGDGELAARALATRLKKEDKIVIMMDDIWERLELREIGIPIGDEHKGLKILFTTRSLEACNKMESDDAIFVNVLNEADSWKLFNSKAGDVSNYVDIKPIAEKVVKECGGLPLAVAVVGRALRNCKVPSQWDNARIQLKRSIPHGLAGVEDYLFKSLELSYNYISDREMKLLFLFCCLFREDYEISEDELTRYAVGEGFLSNTDTLNDARRTVNMLVLNLTNCCLLQSSKESHVKMHDVVRDVAVYIASREDEKFIVKAGLGVRVWPEDRALGVCKRISLMNNDICDLPDQPDCPQLLTLLLNINLSLQRLPGNFFRGMSLLAVLDLSYTGIESLPFSLGCLTNLGSLRLDRCKKLRDISLLGRLKNLKILGLQKCPINVLPQEIGTLTKLKLLDLSYSTSSLIIPPDLICKLTLLEELFMIGYDMNDALFSQIGFLRQLAFLQVSVCDVKYFSQDVKALHGWRNLTKFIISTDSCRLEAVLHERNLHLKNVSRTANWAKILLGKSEDLFLDGGDWGPNDVGDILKVKKFTLANSSSVESLLNTTQREDPPNAFTDLISLSLRNLENLIGICQGVIPAESFGKLRALDVVRCKKLACVIPNDLLQRANCTLEFVSVNWCDDVREVFNKEGLEVVLPGLKKLNLTSLPKLERIWSTNSLPGVGSLQKLSSLQIIFCNELEYLFFQDTIQGCQKLYPTGTFANLKELDIGSCSRLKQLLLPSIAHDLQNLEKLKLKKNLSMVEVIGVEDGVLLDKGAFPRLKEVEFIELPELKSFYCGEPGDVCFNWPSVELFKMELCHKMKRLPLGLESAPKLKKMHLGNGDEEWFMALEWEDESIRSRFETCYASTA